MSYGIVVSAFAFAGFMAIVLSLTQSQNVVRKILTFSFVTALTGGIILYAFGFSADIKSPSDVPGMIFKTLAATAEMFTGNDHYDEITENGGFLIEDPFLAALFWLMHILAVYATASALLATLGRGLMRRMRYRFYPYRHIIVLYHVNHSTVGLAEEIIDNEYSRIIFVDDPADSDKKESADAVSGIIIDEESLLGDAKGTWLKNSGVESGKHDIRFVLMEPDPSAKNFILSVLNALKVRNIGAGKVKFSVMASMELHYAFLQDALDNEGCRYNVHIFTRAALAARSLLQAAPPYKVLKFDEKCVADRDFTALIIGFGATGQEVLKQLIMNAQFLGSHFHATIVDRNFSSNMGSFRTDFGYILKEYDISFLETDARSEEFADMLKKTTGTLEYVVACAGGHDENSEIIERMQSYHTIHASEYKNDMVLAECNADGAVIYDCITDRTGMVLISPFIPVGHDLAGDMAVNDYRVNSLNEENILFGRSDMMAYSVNAVYAEESKEDAEQSWLKLDTYSRNSSRASADFVPAMLALAHISESEAAGNCFRNMEPEKLTQLGKTEHLRWNAFQIANGVVPMSVGEMRERSKAGEKKIQKNIPVHIVGGRHVCITGWDELDDLSEEYEKLTGKKIDYKQMDINNVLNIPEILRIYKSLERGKK